MSTNNQNSTAVIVAVPRATDPIRLVGDEDKHATLLFFGETSSLPTEAKSLLTKVTEQASKTFFPFNESILNVSRLGSDTPPALVALLTGMSLGTIRDALKMDSNVRDYLKNADQHPKFTPHVTLGYPDYAGEQELRDLASQLYRIQFDRLALWWNDEQIEFNLDGKNLDSPMSEAAHADHASDILAHHGIKGMKWGVRRTRSQIEAAKSADHQRVADVKAKAKATKVSSLSNQELRTAIERMNLEQQYSRLSSNKQSKLGSKFVSALLGDVAKRQVTRVANDYATQQVNDLLKKQTA